MKKLIFVLTAALALSLAVYAADLEPYRSSGDLLEYQDSMDEGWHAYYIGYLAGSVDMLLTVRHYGYPAVNICIPGDVQVKKIDKVFRKYARKHLGDIQYAAPEILIPALIEAFPCD